MTELLYTDKFSARKKPERAMKTWQKVIMWALLGAAFGTFTGMLSRRFDYWSLTGGILAGMLAAPFLIIVLLLTNYWDELVNWAIGGALIGAGILTVIGYISNRILSPVEVSLKMSVGGMVDRAIIGAVLSTWLASGGVVFRKGTTGIIGLFSSIVFGAPLGALVRVLGANLGGGLVVLSFLGQDTAWSWGETVVGIPVGLFVGFITTKIFFRAELEAN